VPIQDVSARVAELLTAHGTLQGVLTAQGEWPTKLRAAASLIRRLADRLPPVTSPTAGQYGEVKPQPALFDSHDLASAPFAIEQVERAEAEQAGIDATESADASGDSKGEPDSSIAAADRVRENGKGKTPGRAKSRQGIAARVLLPEALRILPQITEMTQEADVRAYLLSHLHFNSEETRQRNASYLFSQVFIHGFPDLALQTFARCFAGRPSCKTSATIGSAVQNPCWWRSPTNCCRRRWRVARCRVSSYDAICCRAILAR
jgi:hypothetical protein